MSDVALLTREQIRAIVLEAMKEVLADRAPDPDRYLTPDQAAEYLGVSTRTLGNYRRHGLQVHRARGGKPRYLREDLDRFMEGD